MTKHGRIGITCAWVALCAFGVMFSTLPPRFDRPAPRAAARRRAAIALRDHVSPFQKYGTKLFMAPTLSHRYDKVYYLTESSPRTLRASLLPTLEEALSRYEDVDLFLAAHGNGIVSWLKVLPEAKRRRLRLVYNTGCANAYQADAWAEIGARAYVGHPGTISASPIFLVFFMREWVAGAPLDEAVTESNQRAARVLSAIELLAPQGLSAGSLAEQTHALRTGDAQLSLTTQGGHHGAR